MTNKKPIIWCEFYGCGEPAHPDGRDKYGDWFCAYHFPIAGFVDKKINKVKAPIFLHEKTYLSACQKTMKDGSLAILVYEDCSLCQKELQLVKKYAYHEIVQIAVKNIKNFIDLVDKK